MIPHCYVQGNWEASAMQAQTPQKQIRRNQASSAGLQMQPGLVNPLQNTSRLYLPRLKQLSVELVAGFADFSKGTKFGKPRVRMQNPGQRKLLFMAHRPSDQLSPRVVLYSFCVHFSIPLDKPPLLRVAHCAAASFQDCKGTRHSKRTNRCAQNTVGVWIIRRFS